MVSVRDVQIAVFSLVTLFSLFLAAVFRRIRFVEDLMMDMPWLDSFNIQWASSIYGIVALFSMLVVVFLQQTKQ